TSRLAGTELPGGAPYDPSAPLAALIRIKPPIGPMGEAASPDLVRGIVDELRLVPPVHATNDPANDIGSEAVLPFPAKALEAYHPDYASVGEIENNPSKYPLRVAVLKAAQVLRDNVHKFRMKEIFNGRTTAQVKQ